MAARKRVFITFLLVYFPACSLLRYITRRIVILVAINPYFQISEVYGVLNFLLGGVLFSAVLFGALFSLIWVVAGGRLSAYLTKRNTGIIFAVVSGRAIAWSLVSSFLSIFILVLLPDFIKETEFYKALSILLALFSEAVWLATIVISALIIWKLTFRLGESLTRCFVMAFGNGRSRLILPSCLIFGVIIGILMDIHLSYMPLTAGSGFLGMLEFITSGVRLTGIVDFKGYLVPAVIALAIYKVYPATEETVKENC